MESNRPLKHKYLINPNTRLRFPYFCLYWHEIDASWPLPDPNEVDGSVMEYKSKRGRVVAQSSRDSAQLHMLCVPGTEFDNQRLQKWLRDTIRDTITRRAELVLPARLHELEQKHQLWARSVTVTHLRRRVMGLCDCDKNIMLSPLILLMPAELMDETILHEMAHLKEMSHHPRFWQLLSTLLGEDAKQRNMIYEQTIARSMEMYDFLMR